MLKITQEVLEMGLFKPNVHKLEAKKDVKGLIKALKEKDSNVQGEAVGALMEKGKRKIVQQR